MAYCRKGTLDTAAVQTHVGNSATFRSVLTVNTPDTRDIELPDSVAPRYAPGNMVSAHFDRERSLQTRHQVPFSGETWKMPADIELAFASGRDSSDRPFGPWRSYEEGD
jgi:hypothetical protein